MLNLFRKSVWYVSSRTPPLRGKERLVALLSRPNSPRLLRIKRGGVFWLLQGHDLNEFALAIRPSYSHSVSESLAREIETRTVQVLWDVGANIGAISLPLLKKYKQLHAVLFEPSAEVAGRLIRNLCSNKDLWQRSKIMNIALSNVDGITNFHVSSEQFNSGTGGLGLSHNRFDVPIGIQSFTGDNLVASGACPIPELIKIDVEGFEYEVFTGLTNTLITHHPSIIFEHSLYRLKERNLPLDKVVSLLDSYGYGVFRQPDNKPVTSSDLDRDADFVARAI